MSTYNYKIKMDYRNNLMNNISNNSKNVDNLTMQQWYIKYMPFLPKEVLDIIPVLENDKKKIEAREECFEYFKKLYEED